ncbi:MAG: hypothetical protein IJP68_12150, partial [Selenomonadaceae bacterium]|nr:hypothetical protein [Selenomonadaceae bacterium]
AEIKFTNPTSDIWWNCWALNKIYNADSEQIADFSNAVNSFDAHQWNMSLATLKGGAYLFGIHDDQSRDIDGKLYKISSGGQVEQVGDGLKNFRLRELKNIRKAKK